jgi:SNF2 family DNA or RNA helicase
LLDAQVDLNPHQVEASLFAFKSPLSKGANLADEVGLGKTIEAGLVLAQKWTEGKRRILIVCPANLRKQWSQEMAEKFFLPTVILETATYNRMRKEGVGRPFEQPTIIICSFQFAASQGNELMVTKWDLATRHPSTTKRRQELRSSLASLSAISKFSARTRRLADLRTAK